MRPKVAQRRIEAFGKRFGEAHLRANGVPYYRPWIFLITDGFPTDNWQEVAKPVRQAEAEDKLCFFAIGVEGADMKVLGEITSPERPPIRLNNLDFRTLFTWLSSSVKQVSRSKIGEVVKLLSVEWDQSLIK